MESAISKFGLITGLIISLVFIISYALLGDPSQYGLMEVIGWAGIFLALICVYLGIKRYRDDRPGGLLSFGKAFRIGAGISAIAGLVVAVYTVFHVEVLDPDYGDKYTDWTISQVEASGASPEEVAKQVEKLEADREMWGNALIQALVMFGSILVPGVIVALISAAILKRSGPAQARA